jgi:hypothetical protein
MPIRDQFPAEYFTGNPYEGLDPEDVYRKIQWGNEPQELYEIDAPEALANLGEVAMLASEVDELEYSEDEAPFLAVGVETNRLYVVPKGENGEPVDIPSSGYVQVCPIVQTDYYSSKGGEDAYYYHEHEDPFPMLYVHPQTGVMIIEPNRDDEGKRSYAVGDEGVIG